MPAGRPRKFTKEESADRNRARNRVLQTAYTRQGQEIGALPKIKDKVRRAECGESLELFGTTYFRETLSLPCSEMHREVLRDMEEVIRKGGLKAEAMPRGSGKTAWCRIGSLWAILYGYRHYVYFIGANAKRAKRSLEAIKAFVWIPKLLEDFPESIYPLRCLRRQPRSCLGQMYDGEQTLTQWGAECLVFPTMPKSPASAAVINCDGIAAGFRGAEFTHPSGEQVRPDLLIIDDPQTDISAKSPMQCEDREALVAGAALGLAGPDKKIAAIMPCTVIRQNDMADRMLDTKLHPEWDGSRYGILKSFPEAIDLWGKYQELLVNYNPEAEGDNRRAEAEAQQHYKDHIEEMNVGAELTWPERYSPDCVDGLEYAMRLKIRDERSFWSEYMNQPKAEKQDESDTMKPFQIASKISNYERNHIPVDTTKLTLGIDCHKKLLYWVLGAFDDSFNGYIINYGTFPKISAPYFHNADAPRTIAHEMEKIGILGEEAQLFAALTALTDALLKLEWRRGVGGAIARIEKCVLDAGWMTDTVYKFCRQSPFSALMVPSHGRLVGARHTPMHMWKRPPGDRRGLNWFYSLAEKRAIRHLLFDTNFWKTYLHARLKTPPGNAGCLQLFGKGKPDIMDHRMYTDHLTAEKPMLLKSEDGTRSVEEWEEKPHRDNHFFDATILCMLGASVLGSQIPVHKAQAKPTDRYVDFGEEQKRNMDAQPGCQDGSGRRGRDW